MTQTRTFPARSSLGGPSTANDGSLCSAEVGSHVAARARRHVLVSFPVFFFFFT